MIGLLLDKTATIVRRSASGTKDALGKPVVTETSRTTAPARLDQRGSREGEAYVVDSWVGMFQPDADIRPLDRVEEGGRVFEVQGTPARYGLPIPGIDHVEVDLKYVGRL